MFCRTASLSVTISFFAHRICVYVLVGLMFEVQSIGGDASLFARIGFVPTGSLPHGRGPYPAILLSVLFAQEIQQLQRRNEQAASLARESKEALEHLAPAAGALDFTGLIARLDVFSRPAA
eukprot:g14123.t1